MSVRFVRWLRRRFRRRWIFGLRFHMWLDDWLYTRGVSPWDDDEKGERTW